jgi:hypothetical protein
MRRGSWYGAAGEAAWEERLGALDEVGEEGEVDVAERAGVCEGEGAKDVGGDEERWEVGVEEPEE